MSIAIPAEHQVGHAASNGRLRRHDLEGSDRNWAIALHLSPLGAIAFGPLILTPLIIWLVLKDKSSFVDDHGRAVINFGLSYLLFSLLFFWTIVIPMALFVVAIVNLIRGGVAASNGEYFRYPLTIRFLS